MSTGAAWAWERHGYLPPTAARATLAALYGVAEAELFPEVAEHLAAARPPPRLVTATAPPICPHCRELQSRHRIRSPPIRRLRPRRHLALRMPPVRQFGGTVTGAALERFEPTGVHLVDEAVLYLGAGNNLPDLVPRRAQGTTAPRTGPTWRWPPPLCLSPPRRCPLKTTSPTPT